MPSEMPRMIGDFDDSANPLWSLHTKEAKSHDEARIQSLKDDMDGILIFVRVYIYIIIFYRADAASSRPVYSLLLSPPLSPTKFITFKSIQHNRWSTTSNRMSHYSLRSPSRSPLSLHRFPSHPLHLHLIPISLQTLPMSRSMLSGS